MTTMRARAVPAVVLLSAVAALVATPEPAQAQSSGSCGLSIKVPAAASPAQASAIGAAPVVVPLGAVEVCVTVGLLSTKSFTVKVQSDGFRTGGASAAERIAAERITYQRSVLRNLAATRASISNCPATSVPLSSTEAKTVVSCSVTNLLSGLLSGPVDAKVDFTPTLSVDVSGAQVAGTYSGTITHSVA
jgi:hypothetical protein